MSELPLDNLCHVQHHAAQLNLVLRQKVDAAPAWVARAKRAGSGEAVPTSPALPETP